MYLKRIIEKKKQEVATAKDRNPLSYLVEAAEQLPAPKPFRGTLANQEGAIIAEIKRRSPSRGVLAEGINVPALAKIYASNGASALSVLTDREFFWGEAKDISLARSAVSLPILRKDFIIDPYQIYESRLMGADCILLIADVLDEESLSGFIARAAYLGMDCLVEVHELSSLKKALYCGANLIGINNRDLKTFEVDIKTTLELRPFIPEGITVVSESGIKDRQDIEELARAKINAFLVGEALVTAPDVGAKLRALLGREKPDGVH